MCGGQSAASPRWFRYFLDIFRAKKYFITEEAGISHLVPDYELVIKKGLRHIDRQARQKLAGQRLSSDQEAFYQGLRLVIRGIRRMALNLAAEAERLAAEEIPERSRELLEAAAICRRVPYKPARSFREGLQSAWLIHVALNMEDFTGYFFRQTGPFLTTVQRRSKRPPTEQGRELLACFCLNVETIPLYSERINRYRVRRGRITLGVDSVDDTTNELSHQCCIPTGDDPEPVLHARPQPHPSCL